MQKYAKLIYNEIEFAPKNKGSILNYDLDVEQMLADGYKPFTPVERPVTNRRYHIEYEETEIEIVEAIVYNETQEEADEREAQSAKQQQIQEIKEELNQLDLKSIRAIRANDTEYIERYEAEAQELREQLRELG